MSSTTQDQQPGEGTAQPGAAGGAVHSQGGTEEGGASTPSVVESKSTGEGVPSPPAAGAHTPAPTSPPKWAQDRIDELTRKRHEAERVAHEKDVELTQLRAHLAQLQGQQQPTAPQAGGVSEAEIRARVSQEAQTIEFNRQCNEIAAKGNTEFKGGNDGPSFAEAMQAFQRLGGLNQPFLEAALETDTPHKTLYELAKNPDEAYRILQLPPVRMAAAVAKFGAKMAVPPRPTSAPDPTRPVVGGTAGRTGNVDLGSADTDIGAWMKKRDADVLAERQARRRPGAA